METTEQVFDYRVSFIGDDTTVTFTITETSDSIADDVVIAMAEKELCALWGVTAVPHAYYVPEVEMYGHSL